MNFAVIGSGGREHAICYKLSQSKIADKIICIPGNAGTKKIVENISEDINNFEAIYGILKRKNIDIVVVGLKNPWLEELWTFLKINLLKCSDQINSPPN